MYNYTDTLVKIVREVTHRTGHVYQDVERTYENGLVRDVVVKKPVVHILAVEGPLDGPKDVLLTREFRAGLGQVGVGLPAGHIEEGESAFDAANRELQEEVGYRGEAREALIGPYHTPAPLAASAGWTDELKSLVVVWDLVESKLPGDEDESVEQFWVSGNKAVEMALAGEIEELAAVTTILAARIRGWI